MFSEEPDALRAFVALLGRAQFGAAASDTLPELLTESQKAAEEVTETLGRQARDAVELLILTLDRLDADSDGARLAGADDVPRNHLAGEEWDGPAHVVASASAVCAS